MSKIFKYAFFCLTVSVLYPTFIFSQISLPAIFSDNMVLQRNSEITLWGWAKSLEIITVTVNWKHPVVQDTASSDASWKVNLKTPDAVGPYTITISGTNTFILENVMVGEVWLCSGQSNMEWSARAGIDNATEEILTADYPYIRFFQVSHRAATTPQLDLAGEWQECTPQTMVDFSAVGYFFGRELHETLGIPVGLINSSWGGTPAEAWINAENIQSNPRLSEAALKIRAVPWCPVFPGSAYNAMIAPLIPFEIAGVIWYQGETNAQNADTYAELFETFIRSWRAEWQKDFPFYYAQIAPYDYGKNTGGVRVREAQRRCLAVPNTGMVVTSDIGNVNDIHPRNKQEVGKRLALWALANTYDQKGISFSGPLYREMKIEDNKIRLFFDFADTGLVCKGDKLTHFQISGEDRVFVNAEASIDGNTVVVQNKNVKNPVAVRFAWSNTAEPNFFNAEGFPASCFRTDNW